MDPTAKAELFYEYLNGNHNAFNALNEVIPDLLSTCEELKRLNIPISAYNLYNFSRSKEQLCEFMLLLNTASKAQING